MATKISGAKVGDEKLKKFLKQEKGMRRMAYGEKEQTVESWRGQHYLKDVKEKVKGSEEYRETVYGHKTSATEAFRDTVREEIRQDEAAKPAGPSAEEQERQKRLEMGKQRLRQFEQARQIEKEQGKALPGGSGAEPGAPKAASTTPPPSGAGFSGRGSMAGGTRSGARSAGPPAAGGTIYASAPRSIPRDDSLPATFGLRGRVLRPDSQNQQVFIRVLNTPPELAIFIGRDLEMKVTPGTKYWKDRHPTDLGEISLGDHLDARGKILNDEFIADDVYVNNGELPDFVVQLGSSEPSTEIPTAPPDELAI